MKPPYKVLFSNDTTNIVSCTSPYHQKGEPFRPEMLEAAVDETAGTGIDAHLYQPGVVVVPWWKSRQYPYAEHARWFEETYGVGPRENPYSPYMLGGGDMVDVFVRRCRGTGLAPFISLRLNDSHGKEFVDGVQGDGIKEIPGFALHCINRFYKEHPEYRLGTVVEKENWNTRVLNWKHQEVRDWMFGFIREICEGYAIDGLELDFQRHCSYFRPDETSLDERRSIMTGFVGRVRDLLDATSPSGQHRWLCARLPCYLDAYDALGLHLPDLVDAGLEMINVSPYYFTVQQTDFPKIRKLAGDAAVYLEMCHSIWNGAKLPGGNYDNFTFRRATPEQLYTTAHLAYAGGADGVSAFNFVYYREHGTEGRGPFHEPPFHVFEHLGDPDWLASQPQHYFLATGWNDPFRSEKPIPRTVHPGEEARFALDLAPPADGWSEGGRLRIQSAETMRDHAWTAKLNGRQLGGVDDVSEPYPNPYPSLLGEPEQLRAWGIPADALENGSNVLEFKLETGSPVTIIYLDLALGACRT